MENKTLICKNCGDIVFIDEYDIQKSLYNILRIIQNGTNKKVTFIDTLTFLDNIVKCCEKPNYWEAET